MWRALSTFVGAVGWTILQLSFFSHLAPPLSTLSFPLIAIVVHLVRERPVHAAGWALVAGVLIDVHGLFSFGTETALLFATFGLARFLHARVLTNASAPAAFLLAVCATLSHDGLKLAIDGLRVLFGAVPYALVPSFVVVTGPLVGAIANGLIVICLLACGRRIRALFRKTFLSSSHVVRT